MFVIANETAKLPVKVWLPGREDLEDSCMEQASHLANLPFLHKWVSLMSDTHTGMGMPIGGVIAAEGTIIPNAVGVDIGCGMSFIGTDLKITAVRDIMTGSGSLLHGIVGDILRSVPVGFAHHNTPQSCKTLDTALQNMDKYETDSLLCEQIAAGYYQLGTLGGGNHFIEFQEDEDGNLGIMLHSGSRNFGKRICDYFNDIAKEQNERWFSEVPSAWQLSFLPAETGEGKRYIAWMNLALDFAKENRAQMQNAVCSILEKHIEKYTNISFSYTDKIDCHHNYAALEQHYGKNVCVHRKGATRARTGDTIIIPGAMGSYSYIAEGLGSEESFCSSSHGAGRRYSRKAATEKFSVEEVVIDLKAQNIILGKHNKSDVAEESRFAYKDIDGVMENQTELVRPVKKLKTVGVVKG